MAPSAAAVSAKLHSILQDSDLDTMTERMLAETLSKHFETPMDDHAELIQRDVLQFVQDRADQLVTPTPSAKRDREPDAAAGPAAKATKVAAPDGSTYTVPLDDKGLLLAKVKEFKGKMYIDLRTHWEKDGEQLPGKKGIMLSLDDWSMLSSHFGHLQQALQASNLDTVVQLSGTRRASVGEFKKRVSVDVREWYDKDGELKPGTKGVSLGAEQLQVLMDAAPALTAAAGGDAAAPAPAPSAPVPAAQQPAAASGAPASAPAAAAPGVAQAGTSLQSGTGDTILQLGGNKFASVSQFKGNWMVGLREFYEKEGKWMPGKKGISLSRDQYTMLVDHAQAISDALAAKDAAYNLQLSTMRKVNISTFKGMHFANIREYYQKGDELAPGTKGVALKPEQWSALCASMGHLASQMA